MRAIYVDDSRNIVEILKSGVVFDSEKGLFIYSDNTENYIETDIKENMKRTEVEIGKAMNFISSDLKFTTETERDFRKKRLPTLSFETWSTRDRPIIGVPIIGIGESVFFGKSVSVSVCYPIMKIGIGIGKVKI